MLTPHPVEVLAGVHDVMAAELLAAAAETNAGAQQLVNDLNDTLTTAYVHRMRSGRLNDAAVQATMSGAHDVAALIGRFAAEEMEAADEFEAVGAGTIRSMHSFGYMSPAEIRFMRRKKFEEGMSAGQAEQVFSKLLDNLYQSAVNFGSDEEGFGGEGHPEASEPEELDDGTIELLGAVAEALGGDMPLVFGANCYEAFHGVYGASLERLLKRRARTKTRLDRNMEKLESLEDAGKSGIRVRWLRMRVGQIERRLEKLNSKIRALKGTSDKMEESEGAAEQIEAAETSAIKAASEEGLAESDMDSLEAELAELDESELSEADLLEEEQEEYGMLSELEVFGASERRINRVKRRLIKLKARLDKLESKHRGLFRKARFRRLRKRIARIEAKLDKWGEDAPSMGPSAYKAKSYTSSLTSPILSAYSAKEYLDTYKGALNVMPEVAGRQPFVQFFRRQAENKGSMNLSPEVFGAEGEGFFQRVGGWFMENIVDPIQGLFTPELVQKRQDRRRARREKARAYIQRKTQQLQARRAARRQATQDLGIRSKREAVLSEAKALRKLKRDQRKATRPQRQAMLSEAKALRRLKQQRRQTTREAGSEFRRRPSRSKRSPRSLPAAVVEAGELQIGVPDGRYEDAQYVYEVRGGQPFLLANKETGARYAPGSRLIKAAQLALSRLASGANGAQRVA